MAQCRKLVPVMALIIVCLMSLTGSVSLFGGIDKSSIPPLRWVGPGKPGTFKQYREKHPILPFKAKILKVTEGDISVNPQKTGKPGALPEKGEPLDLRLDTPAIYPQIPVNGEKLLILVNGNIFNQLENRIRRYVATLEDRGCTAALHILSGGTAEELKAYIKKYSDNLMGCVLIGNFQSAWFEEPDSWGSDEKEPEFPCDLFLMDLDGMWQDLDGDGIYDLHTDGDGDQAPEIFVARIDATPMSGDEVQILKNFFDKNNRYWTGNMDLFPFGLTYIEDDWAEYWDMAHDIVHLYGSNYTSIIAPQTEKVDYRDLRLKNPAYEFVQLACHSSSRHHEFTRGGNLTNTEILETVPRALGYNLFCCSGARFTDTDFIAGSYVFNSGNKALVAVGSTKTGSMLEFHKFYKPLGENKPIGQAFKLWFEAEAPYSASDLSWYYGMVIIGDPMISFRNVDLSAEKPVFPPLGINITREENRSLFAVEYIDNVSWTANPVNNDFDQFLSEYRVYLVDEEGRVLERIGVAEPGSDGFLHRGVDPNKTYRYAVSAVNTRGKESSKTMARDTSR